MHIISHDTNSILLPISHDRFLCGEIVAALLSIHELGFSYGDLKPENVLITEIGHIKVISEMILLIFTSTVDSLLMLIFH